MYPITYYRFPVADVDLVLDSDLASPSKCGAAERFVFKEEAFVLDIEEVAQFTVRNGNHVRVRRYPDVERGTLELYLNGSVWGAILHQRQIPPLHASCFAYGAQGVMVCGESGAGKSSLTAAFCLEGADFLTDDVTPVVLQEGWPCAWGVSNQIKLWEDSLQQLDQRKTALKRVGAGLDKYYLPMKPSGERLVPLHHVFVLAVHDEPTVRVQAVSDGVGKFTALRNAMYREEYWRAMPGGECAYFDKFIGMSKRLTVTKIMRPKHYPIQALRDTVAKRIAAMSASQESGDYPRGQ